MVHISEIEIISVDVNVQGIVVDRHTLNSDGEGRLTFVCSDHYLSIDSFIELLYLEEVIPLSIKVNNKFVPTSKYDSTYIFHEDAVSVRPAHVTLASS